VKEGWVYLLANKRNGTTYLGVTSDLKQRIWQHRTGAFEGFSKEHGCKMLVWVEHFSDLQDARAQEWRMKKWKRAWKLALIEKNNPQWRDLWDEINNEPRPIRDLRRKPEPRAAGSGAWRVKSGAQ